MTEHQPHFLVPVKLDGQAVASLSLAVDMAREAGGRVTLVHVRPRHEGLDAIEYLHDTLLATRWSTPETRDDCPVRGALQDLLRSVPLAWHRDLRLRALIRHGDVAQEILAAARENAVETMVLDIGVRRWWRFGRPVTDYLLRHAPCRILLVHPDPRQDARRSSRAVEQLEMAREE